MIINIQQLRIFIGIRRNIMALDGIVISNIVAELNSTILNSKSVKSQNLSQMSCFLP